MSQTLLPPDFRRMVARLEQRLAAIERRLNVAFNRRQPREILFTLPGLMTTSESPPVRLQHSGILVSILVLLGTAGDTATTIEVRREGAAVCSAQLAAGTTVARGAAGARFGADQEALTVAVTQAGINAENLTVHARFT